MRIRGSSLLLLLLLFLLAGCGGSALPAVAIEHNRAGAEHLRANRLDQAEARFRLALEYRSRFAEPHANLGLVAYMRGRLRQAEEHLRTAISLNEDFASAWANLGVVLEQENRNSEARDAYEHALRIDPAEAGARRNLAFLLARADLFVEARAHLMRLVEIDPTDFETNGVLAWCDLRMHRAEAAGARAEEILVQSPEAATALLVRGSASAMRGDLDGAYDDLVRAAHRSVLAREATRRLAAIELLRGHVVEAESLVRELLGDDEQDAAAHLVAASIALVDNRLSMAREHATSALMIRPTLDEAHLILAEVAARMGHERELDHQLEQVADSRYATDKARIRAMSPPSRSDAQMW